jgi:hypothetical protein
MSMTRKRTIPSEKLFAEPQPHMFDQSYEGRLREQNRQPVECLGMTFPNNEERM